MKQDSFIADALTKIYDFPSPGINFYDITSLLLNPSVFQHCIEQMQSLYQNQGIEIIAPIESRGFLFAAPLAIRMGLPLLLIRKKGKLPRATLSKEFELEYGKEIVEVHKDDVPRGKKVLIVDDVLATGGTTLAACQMLHEAGAVVQDVVALIGLTFLSFKEKLSAYKVQYLVEY